MKGSIVLTSELEQGMAEVKELCRVLKEALNTILISKDLPKLLTTFLMWK